MPGSPLRGCCVSFASVRRSCVAPLAGGVALSGAYLGHRLSKDVDLFLRDRSSLRRLADALAEAAQAVSGSIKIVQDAGTFIRAKLQLADQRIEVDPAADHRRCGGPLDRGSPGLEADVPAHADLELALKKDAGVDPAVMAWLKVPAS